MQQEKLNVLLITVDQMRGDCLSAAGHSVVETPNLDKLANRGVFFKNAYSATPSCIPARAAIFTGMSQRSHGRVGYMDQVPWTYPHMLPGELAAAGYHTQCVGKMHVYPTRNLCGFHNVVLHDGYMHYNRDKSRVHVLEHYDQCDDYLHWLRGQAGVDQDLIDHGLDCNASTVTRPWHLEEKYHPTNWVVSESIDFLRRRDPSKPFFLWTSFVRPHPPFDPPQVYFDMYKDLDIPLPPVGSWVDSEAAAKGDTSPETAFGKLKEARLKRALAGYYALITHLDDQIGRLMNALSEHGVLNDTVILFTSDHGELMGDHHYFRKSLPYEGSAKVPFLLYDPGNRLSLKGGSTIDHVVEMRDIMPTLLEAAGVPIPDSVDGKSVLDLCRGEVSEWREYIHGEHSLDHLSNHYITDGKMKYIWFSQSGREQLFNLIDDPHEVTDLANSPSMASELVKYRNILIQELAGREEGYSDGTSLIVGRKPLACLSHLLHQS
ncbi:arylsulfatase [Paenibacillus faecalis]|uniref:arylsulfatase n=1 Tax=Paenibacillus faecalis TaxID=2079532 RepID=UPI000D1093BA|nr:arylsulfatase [Paenibacillus faecalis]